MPLRLEFERAIRLSPGIWEAAVDRSELDLLAGRPLYTPGPSVLAVATQEEDGADPDAGRITARLDSATLLVLGAEPRIVVVYSGAPAVDTPAALVPFLWLSAGNSRTSPIAAIKKNRGWFVEPRWARTVRTLPREAFVVLYCADTWALYRLKRPADYPRPDDRGPFFVPLVGPLETRPGIAFADVWTCLRDREGRPYRSARAAGRAIGGPGGVFRQLDPREVQCLFATLGWDLSKRGVEG